MWIRRGECVMLVGSYSKAPVRVNDKGQVIHAILGRDDIVAEIPHAQLVELPDRVIQEPHFHEIDQYQMIMVGSGRIGKTPMRPGHYHYTDRATTYGPIVGNPGGVLHYLVLRPRGEPGVDISGRFMPQSRHLRSRRPGRHLYGDATIPDAEALGEWVAPADHGKGGIVTSVALPAGATVMEPDGRTGSGPGYIVVLEGSLVIDGETLDPASVIWVEVTDSWPRIAAGPDGAKACWFTFSIEHATQRTP